MKTTTQNQNQGLQSRPEQSGTSKRTPLPKLDFQLRQRNRKLPQRMLLGMLQSDAPDSARRAQLVGQWVWIRFSSKQPREITATLSQLGFHWNRRRQTWQHPCGCFVATRADYDPRSRYGCRPVKKTN